MLKLNFNLRHQDIRLVNKGAVVASDSKNYLVAKFHTLSDDWETPLTAIFTDDKHKQPYAVIVGANEELADNECFVPWEVLTDECNVYVSVYCGNLHTTVTAAFKVRKSGYTDGETPPPPSPTVYDIILQAINDLRTNKQDKLTAGDNITIENDVISAEGGVTNYNELENKPILQIQSASGTTENITLENVIKLFPFYKDVWSDYINVDLSGCYKTDGTGTTSVTNFNRLLYDDYHNNSAKLYSVNSQGIPQSINAKNNLFVLYQFGVQNSYSSQLIFWVDSTTNESKCAYRVCEYNHNTQQYNTPDFIELGSGGAQIVSGVVNANGTITFTDSEGNSFTTSGESVIGADGFSPSATVQQTASGATITVTDKNGTTTANISNGQDGNDYVLTAQDKSDIADIVLAEFTGSIVNGELNTR